MAARTPIFDLDGTLIDSDEALIAPFVALGVPRAQITFGHVLADECARLGITVEDYLDHYDSTRVVPFAGVEAMLRRLTRWAVCSNKHPSAAHRELEQLAWSPDVALFSDAFGGPKRLEPVLDALGLGRDEVVFVGDTEHDRDIALDLGVPFGLAAWNPRAEAMAGDVVLREPADVLAFCDAPLSGR